MFSNNNTRSLAKASKSHIEAPKPPPKASIGNELDMNLIISPLEPITSMIKHYKVQ